LSQTSCRSEMRRFNVEQRRFAPHGEVVGVGHACWEATINTAAPLHRLFTRLET